MQRASEYRQPQPRLACKAEEALGMKSELAAGGTKDSPLILVGGRSWEAWGSRREAERQRDRDDGAQAVVPVVGYAGLGKVTD